MTWTATSMARGAGGRWLAEPASTPAGASIDTRTLRPGNLFFALRGERSDGHDHLEAAAEAGASALVVERAERVPAGVGVLLVDDARAALGRIASAYRDTFGTTRVIGVTGSAGKTTTVRLIEGALRTSLSGTASERSFNNDLGVPLTILNADPNADFVICEIGTNAPGEIEWLSRLARPDIAVVTTVGRAHLEGFGTVEAILREKASIARGLRPGGVALVNADVRGLADAMPPGVSVRTFGHATEADIRIESVRADRSGVEITLADGMTARAPLAGRHHAGNICAAIGVARLMGLDDGSISRGIGSARGAPNRMQVEDLGGEVRLIDDAYNANPESMLAALEALADLGAGTRRVAVLGDMLELGEYSPGAHAEAARRASEVADVRVHVGPASARAGREAGADVAIAEASDESLATIVSLVLPGDTVLVKGSRGMRLERVCEAIRQRFAMIGASRADNREDDAGLPQ